MYYVLYILINSDKMTIAKNIIIIINEHCQVIHMHYSHMKCFMHQSFLWPVLCSVMLQQNHIGSNYLSLKPMF